ncbi:MAG: GNAT family N-acetyltransferase [Spirochaetaceae bacterium]|nr:GNAT family N-acetyltransferase [Spirochaetaceae bacterium]
MSWRPAGRDTCRRLIRILKVDEWMHAALASRLKASGGVARFGQISDGRLWVHEAADRIDGGLFISRFGIVLPAYDESTIEGRNSDFLTTLYRSRRDGLFSIIGMENRVMDVEAHLGEKPPDSESYRMFTRDHSSVKENPVPPGITLHKAGPGDINLLWPLERSYQKEEVLRPGSHLDEKHGRRFFMNTLKNQEVYYAALNGKPVAKAGTNARGWNYDQIGGVFVEHALRGHGLGRVIMERLLDAIRTEGRRPCLFVKKSNRAALQLYKSLEFQDRGAFRISYWI